MKAIGRATHVLAVAACLGSAARAQLAAREPQAYMRKVGFQDGDRRSADANAKATELLKQALVRLVQTYLDQGSAGMVVYDNKTRQGSFAACSWARSRLDERRPGRGRKRHPAAARVGGAPLTG
jgi:hypothetical protein